MTSLLKKINAQPSKRILYKTDMDLMQEFSKLIVQPKKNKEKIETFLIEHNFTQNQLNVLLRSAAQANKINIAKLLVSMGAREITEWGNSLVWAARHNAPKIVDLLLSVGANAMTNEGEAIRWACLNGHINAVKVLVGHNPECIGVRDYQCVEWSAERGFSDIVIFLILQAPDRARAQEVFMKFKRSQINHDGHTKVIAYIEEHLLSNTITAGGKAENTPAVKPNKI